MSLQVPSLDQGKNDNANTHSSGFKYPPSVSSVRRSHNQGKEEEGKRRSSGPDGRNGGGKVAKSPLLMVQYPVGRSVQVRFSRDPDDEKGGERYSDNGKS